MSQMQIFGLLFNFIVYSLITMPIYVLSHLKKIYHTEKKFMHYLIISIFYCVLISSILYFIPYKIFSLFPASTGTINYSVYAFKILFACSSLFSMKILIPKYIYYKTRNKKIAIFYYSKIAITLILSILGYYIFNAKGILFAFPLTDFVYSIIYLYVFLNIIRQNI